MGFIPFVLLSTGVFVGIIFILILLLTWVESKVVNKDDCKITINNEKDPLVVPGGGTLLMALANNKIFLPSACGGGGTCAMCKCQITEGGGDILPTEKGLVSRAEQKDHIR
ncbi:MAG: 2Fe-2S iron-sulfur cluster binding domain-containing protein, partial [Candidatus Omnitrophica bacterium]|nr:2Fe-2S iron-sulfur cluster binding domain-containing protein [Candidatus Omnitrophota bacterium]